LRKVLEMALGETKGRERNEPRQQWRRKRHWMWKMRKARRTRKRRR
jgi:hypothetical protein